MSLQTYLPIFKCSSKKQFATILAYLTSHKKFYTLCYSLKFSIDRTFLMLFMLQSLGETVAWRIIYD